METRLFKLAVVSRWGQVSFVLLNYVEIDVGYRVAETITKIPHTGDTESLD